MRRRDLLAAVATAGVTGTAGCGYAHGSGDVRDGARLGTAGFDAESFHAVDGDGLVYATSGRQVVWEDGESTFTDATEVTVWTLGGNRRWSHTHGEPAQGVAAAEDVYLLDVNDDLLAMRVTESESRTASGGEYETGVRWRADLDDPRPPLAADGRGAYVAREDGLLAVREGAVEWSVDLPGTPEALVAVEGVVVASTPGTVVGVSADGRGRWRVDVAGTASMAAAGGRVAVRDSNELRVVRSTDGGDPWVVDLGGGTPATTDEVVYATEYGRVHAFDAETGEELWASGANRAVSSLLVAAPEGVYAVDDHCEAVAVDGDGERWSRELDVEPGCSAVAGWLHGETVAFLFGSGAVRWLQRTDQPAARSV